MNLFIDKNHRRKSPLPLQLFRHPAGPLHLRVLYTLLAEPLYRQLTLPIGKSRYVHQTGILYRCIRLQGESAA